MENLHEAEILGYIISQRGFEKFKNQIVGDPILLSYVTSRHWEAIYRTKKEMSELRPLLQCTNLLADLFTKHLFFCFDLFLRNACLISLIGNNKKSFFS
ncbi:MAG: hypothetical protein ABIA04_01860 [Pseudomonadota bacterium]